MFAAVAFLTSQADALPWLAIALGVTFSLYGLIKKHAPLSPLHGLTIETGILFILTCLLL
jgi:chloramphenicol-sensitive protein RarD